MDQVRHSVRQGAHTMARTFRTRPLIQEVAVANASGYGGMGVAGTPGMIEVQFALYEGENLNFGVGKSVEAKEGTPMAPSPGDG